ncbi:MAG: diiron oxygenase [Dehalococcoidia bacterium]
MIEISNKPIYQSKLSRWDQQASVRAKPHRVMAEEEQGKLYFPPELVPHVQHPLILDRGEQIVRELLIQRLYVYMDFTEILEINAISPVLLQIARDQSGFDLPEEMVRDAYKIYVDEAYHGLFSDDLKRQVESATGVKPIQVPMPNFLRRLDEIESALPEEFQNLARMFFVFVSETLISSILADIPVDNRVATTVREVVADHAEDEGRHHAYFAKLLDFIWPQLTRQERAIAGPLLPQFIRSFLDPDLAAITSILAGYGLTPGETQQVVAESYLQATISSGAREAAKSTLRHIQRNGVLEDMETAEAFYRSDLVPQEPALVAA